MTPFSRFLSFFAAVVLAVSPAIMAQTAAPSQAMSATLSTDPLSERVVDYQIDAHYDARKKSLDAIEILTYHNLTGQPLDTFPFHLYLNGFQPASTFMREVHRSRSSFEWDEKYRASANVTSLEVVGMGDLTSQIKFVSPDDGNASDHSVFEVKLPRAVAPGESVQFKIAFHDQFGEVYARTGYKRDFIMGAQWFPKVGVWWQGAWNCHQFHSTTEFFADFGTFDVKLALPQSEIVGATGIEVSSVNHPDGTKTIAFHAEDVHDFAWTAEPNYKVFEDEFAGSMGRTKIRLLMQPGHASQAARHMRIMKEAMARFDRWYGPYPYPQITVVDPPHGGIEAGGMEYPMLITGGTFWWLPEGIRLVELVVEHEFGHQYWYGMVATNEFEDAWLDEGINSYTECKVLNDIFGKDRSALDLWGMTGGDDALQRWSYVGSADRDPLARRAFEYLNGSSYGDITYGKTATVLLTLEKVIGESTLQRALQVYFVKYRFKHPTKEDFLKTVEEVSGQNLRWYFDQAVFGTQILDYEVLQAKSEKADWLHLGRARSNNQDSYETSVVVHRKGDFIFPVDVRIRFRNGETANEHWDGRDRWQRFSYLKNTRLESAEVDPGHAVPLDKDLFNNSVLKEKDPAARHKLSHYWMIFVQFLAQCLSWLT
jgi:hypothetical protein